MSHILVMDEREETRELLRAALRAEGYRPTVSQHLLDIPEVAALQPDVIVMERSFAGSVLGSWMFLRDLRRDPALAGVPVVLTTRRSPGENEALIAREFAADGIHLLLKPYATHDVLRLISVITAPELAGQRLHVVTGDADSRSAGHLRLV